MSGVDPMNLAQCPWLQFQMEGHMSPELNINIMDEHTYSPAGFSLADCKELDRKVKGSRPPTGVPVLTEKQLKEMQLKLNAIASLYDAERRLRPFNTSLERKAHLAKIREKSLALLRCFDMSQETKPEQVNLAFFTDKHVFHGIEIDGFKFLTSLQTLCDVCDRMDKEELGNPERGRKPDENFHLLIGRLGLEYAVFWGDGDTPANVDDSGHGGPSIRFMHAAAEKITSTKMTHKRVRDAYKAAQKTVPQHLIEWQSVHRKEY